MALKSMILNSLPGKTITKQEPNKYPQQTCWLCTPWVHTYQVSQDSSFLLSYHLDRKAKFCKTQGHSTTSMDQNANTLSTLLGIISKTGTISPVDMDS